MQTTETEDMEEPVALLWRQQGREQHEKLQYRHRFLTFCFLLL